MFMEEDLLLGTNFSHSNPGFWKHTLAVGKHQEVEELNAQQHNSREVHQNACSYHDHVKNGNLQEEHINPT